MPATPKLELALQPWTSWLVVPIFALANAGVAVTAEQLRDSLTSSVKLGVIVGLVVELVVGKVVGIAGASWIACRAGFGELPSGARSSDLIGMALLGGIGLTVSLFITELAFGASSLDSEAKLGIFAAGFVATVLAAGVFRGTRRRVPRRWRRRRGSTG